MDDPAGAEHRQIDQQRHAVARVVSKCLGDPELSNECADRDLRRERAYPTLPKEPDDRPYPSDRREGEQRHVELSVDEVPGVPLEVIERQRMWCDVGR